MEATARASILLCKDIIVEDVDVLDVKDFLIARNMLTITDCQLIESEKVSKFQMSKMVDTLLEKDTPHVYDTFLSALEENYSFIAKRIREVHREPSSRNKDKTVTEIEAVYRRGGVPLLPNVRLERKNYVDDIFNGLATISSSGSGGWMLVHGMGGCGKSVVASMAARDTRIPSLFFNQIHWFSVGKLRGPNEEQGEQGELLMKLQNLCYRLDPSARSPHNIELAKDLLRSIMYRLYPCSLLVLDDVWEASHLRYFDVQACVMVTSRNADILSKVQKGANDRIQQICIDKGFELEQCTDLIASYLNKAKNTLEENERNYIQTLHQVSKGIPFTISLFGALLKEKPERWEFYLKKLKDNALRSFQKDTEYTYTTLDEAIMISIDDLPDKYLDKYKSLVIFPEDTFLTANFLHKFVWSDYEDVEQVEDLLELFVKRSLATTERFVDAEHKFPVFTIHDLPLTVLRSREKFLQEKHTVFVCNVLKCVEKEGWKGISDSVDVMNYIAYNFLYHLQEMERNKKNKEKLNKILKDFSFLGWLLTRIGPANVAYLFSYAKRIDPSNSECFEQFKTFFRDHSYALASDFESNESPDVCSAKLIQMAFFQSEDSEVFKAAKSTINTLNSMLPFYWWVNTKQAVNQIESQCRLAAQMGVYSIRLNEKGTHALMSLSSRVCIIDLNANEESFHISKLKQVLDAIFIDIDNKPHVIVLTEERIELHVVPAKALEVSVSSPPINSSGDSCGHTPYPHMRPRSSTNPKTQTSFICAIAALENEDVSFTAMCYENSHCIRVGTQRGRVLSITVMTSMLNRSEEKDITELYSQIKLEDQENSFQKISDLTISLPTANHAAPRLLLACGPFNSCFIFSTKRFQSKKVIYLGHGSNTPTKVAFEPIPDPTFAVSIANNQVHIWSVTTGETLFKIPDCLKSDSTVTCFDIIHKLDKEQEAYYIAYGSSSAVIEIWKLPKDTSINSLKTPVRLSTMPGHLSCIYSLQFYLSPDRLLSGTDEGTMLCWRTLLSDSLAGTPDSSSDFAFNAKPFSVLPNFDVFYDTDNSTFRIACQFVSKKLHILTCPQDCESRVLNSVATSSVMPSKVHHVSWNSVGTVAVFSLTSLVVFYSTEDNLWYEVKLDESDIVSHCNFFDTNSLVAYNSQSKKIQIFKEFALLSNICLDFDIESDIKSLSFCSSDKNFVLCLGSKQLHVLDLALNKFYSNVCTNNDDDFNGMDVYLSSTSSLCATASSSGRCLLWRISLNSQPTMSLVNVLSRPTTVKVEPLRCVKFCSKTIGSNWLVAGGYDDNTFIVWSVSDTYDSVTVVYKSPSTQQVSSWFKQLSWRNLTLYAASDCLRVVRLNFEGHPPPDPDVVSLYTRSNIEKFVVSPDGLTVVLNDQSRTLYWLRAVNSEFLQHSDVR